MVKALFLDRDGVLDELVYYADTKSHDAPRTPESLRLRPHVREALDLAAKNGWMIFVITNQPDAAKGRTTRDALRAVHARLVEDLRGAPVTEFFYCFHRAEDRCECRKPSPKFVLDAAKKYGIDLNESWFAGDADTDIECGRRAGLRTALLEYEHSRSKRGAERPDWVCRDLDHFVRKLTGQTSSHASRSED
ncbi:MAG TPA: HAD-IIIA family hydrolase [Thermoanaerobaculia bacterium]|nr:HAD-IIIA family hydrolase [Thermoanaerobaculia bacterium]